MGKRAMSANREEYQDDRSNQPAISSAALASIRAIATAGELFPDGGMIELITGGPDGLPRLMLWDGQKETIGTRIEHHGQLYEPARIDGSVLRGLTLPARCRHHGTTRDFLAEICNLLANIVGLPEKPATVVARFVLCSAIAEAVSVAPRLVIVGPDSARGDRLVQLLSRLCWHSLSLTGVTPAAFSSLASGARFTYLISQETVSDRLQKLLRDARNRDQKIPLRGRLLDLFGVQVIHSNSVLAGDSGPLRSVEVSMFPSGQALPPFDQDAAERVSTEFQAKLLSFRRANLRAAQRLRFDASKLDFPLRGLAHSLAAATPDDSELQAGIIDLLRDEDSESRSSAWTDLNVIAVEAVLIALHESPEGVKYVSELAHLAQATLIGRGENVMVDPGAFGKRLKLLGFATEPRDAKGKKLRLTEAVGARALQLARDFGIPEIENGEAATSIPRGNEIDGAAV